MLDVEDCLIKVTLIGRFLGIEQFYVFLEVLPVAHVPGRVGSIL